MWCTDLCTKLHTSTRYSCTYEWKTGRIFESILFISPAGEPSLLLAFAETVLTPGYPSIFRPPCIRFEQKQGRINACLHARVGLIWYIARATSRMTSYYLLRR